MGLPRPACDFPWERGDTRGEHPAHSTRLSGENSVPRPRGGGCLRDDARPVASPTSVAVAAEGVDFGCNPSLLLQWDCFMFPGVSGRAAPSSRPLVGLAASWVLAGQAPTGPRGQKAKKKGS